MVDWFDSSKDVAANVARSVHKKYHTYFGVDDLRQELLVWILKRETKVPAAIMAEDLIKSGSSSLALLIIYLTALRFARR